MKRVEVRPYGVSKGMALATILDFIVEESKKEEREAQEEEVHPRLPPHEPFYHPTHLNLSIPALSITPRLSPPS